MEMEQAQSPRMQQLQKMLDRTPNDPFLLYGLALEYKKLNDLPKALEYLSKTVQADMGYAYAYFQQGQVHEAMGELAAARKAYLDGIDAAAKKGDAHARSELEGALSMIE
jgi:tetratricopeptide (TPR) repeat protein